MNVIRPRPINKIQKLKKKKEEIVDARTKKATYLQKEKYPALKQHPEWVKR